jgi:hypothetical protein
MDNILTTKVLTIREAGHDEYWLRDKIYDDPSQLGLGDLKAVMREKTQSQGGRLDLLLKNPDDDAMFEVELQLGPTDESHIIRAIEYWDNEKRRWPNRSHTAVLVAEEITNRFFNVVHLLSLAVPIIGIEANILQVGDVRGLHFNKIIDSYEEPEESEAPQAQYDERHWLDAYPAALECAKWYKSLLQKLYGEIPIKYFEEYISLKVGGVARAWCATRKNDRVFFEIKYTEQNFQEAVDYLNGEGIQFGTRGGRYLTFNVNLRQLADNVKVHEWIAARLSPNDVKQTASSQNA